MQESSSLLLYLQHVSLDRELSRSRAPLVVGKLLKSEAQWGKSLTTTEGYRNKTCKANARLARNPEGPSSKESWGGDIIPVECR